MDFASIDFETATSKRDSACALGLCVVRAGTIVSERAWVIQPPNNAYDPVNTQIHGMSPASTADAPSFGDVAEEILDSVADLPLVAHNATFDMSVLRNSLDAIGAPYPFTDYYCTLLLSRAHWPDLVAHSLPIVCAQFGLTLDHHDPAADAHAAASILLKIANDHAAQDIQTVSTMLGIMGGQLRDWGYSPCSSSNARPTQRQVFRISSPKQANRMDSDRPFFEAEVAFTGTLITMTRSTAMRLVAKQGGRPRDDVSLLTDYLIVGPDEYHSLEEGLPDKHLAAALELKAGGRPIVILTEQEFFDYI